MIKIQAHILISVKRIIKDPKFDVGDHARISKYKTFLQKSTVQIELRRFVLQQSQKEFRIEKRIKSKCNKLYVKWKGYDDSFKSWVD